MKKQHNHNKIRLTWQNLRDYFSNSLSSGEMHEVEKKVMHDPFSSDAFDGLENFAPASLDNDLSNLKTRLNRKSGFDPDKKQISYGLFIRIAAILVLVFATSGVVIYFSRSSDIVPTNVAQETKKIIPEEANPLFDLNNDSSHIEKGDTETLLSENKVETDEKTVLSGQYARRETINTADREIEQLEPKSATSSLKLTESNKVTATPILGITEDSEVKPVTTNSDNSLKVLTLQQNKASVTVSDSELVEVAEKISGETSGIRIKPDTGKTTEAMNRPKQSAVAAKPPTNMDKYKGVIFRKIMEEEPDAIGEFEVWFTVKENGELSDFEVTKSIDRRTDRKIIRELKNNGDWTPAYISSKPTETRASIQLIF